MDFEKSKINQIDKHNDLIKSLKTFTSSVINGINMKLNIDYDANKL